MDKLNITFCSFPDYSSNAKPLYEYMKKTYADSMNYNWAVSSEEMCNKLRNMGIDAYVIGTDEYFEKMRKTDVFFSTHCNIIGEKNKDAIYIELWHGISPKHIGFMSDNMLEDDRKWYSSIQNMVDYFIVPSDFWRVIFATRFNFKYERILDLGYPKLDFILNPDAKKNLEIVIGRKLDKYNKILFYMPTFRAGCNRKQESDFNTDNLINLNSYDEKVLLDYLKENNYLLCIKKHPSEELELKNIENDYVKVIEEKSLTDNNFTVNDILNAADLMISDYSSLGIEFLFLDKPVVYLTTDVEEYKANRGFTFDNINFWMAGYKVQDINSLMEAIDDSLSDNFKYKEALKDKRELFFSDLKDGGCKKICDYIFENGAINPKLLQVEKDSLAKYTEQITALKQEIKDKDKIIDKRNARIKELDEFIAQLINSKGWQFLEKIRKIKTLGRKKNN